MPIFSPVAILFAIAAAFFGAALCINACSANDLFWQLRTGHEIMINHAVPHADTYSYRRAGTPWVVHEWLMFTLFWLAYHANHFAGVWLLQVSFVTLASLILYFVILRETGGAPLTALAMTTLSLLVAGLFFQPRPQLATYLFLPVVMGLCLAARRSRPKRIYYLLPIFVLWANLHAGVLVGIGLIVAFAICDAAEMKWARNVEPEDRAARAQALPHFAVAAVAGALLTLATPYSWHVYQNFGATISNKTMLDSVTEWFSPNFHEGFGQMLEAYFLVLGASICGSPRRKTVVEVVLIAGLVHESLLSSRNVPLLSLIAGPLIARHTQAAVQRLIGASTGPDFWTGDSLFARRVPLIPAVAVVIALGCISAGRASDILKRKDSQPTRGLEHVARVCYSVAGFPEGACAFVKSEKIPPSMRLYNIYGEGGYIIWTLPDHPVFIDGRADVYFGKSLEDYTKMLKLPFKWEDLLDKNDCGLIISSASDPQSRLFLSSPRWAAIYLDRPALQEKETTLDNSLILVRRTPENAPLIARCRRDCPAFQSPILAQYGDYQALK